MDQEIGENYPCLGMELGLPRDEEGPQHASVKRRAVDVDDRPVGVRHDNPFLDQH